MLAVELNAEGGMPRSLPAVFLARFLGAAIADGCGRMFGSPKMYWSLHPTYSHLA